MATTEVILLERIDNLGTMGEVVRVKPGHARNYLLPQKKALRATKDNVAYFEAQKAKLEEINQKRKSESEKRAESLKDLTLNIIRQAGEKGQLYGSVTSRDIADALTENVMKVERGQINLNSAIKTIGIFPVEVILHPEVRETISINVARNDGEADIQKRTGKAIIADESETTDEVKARAEQQLEAFFEEEAAEKAIEAVKEESVSENAEENADPKDTEIAAEEKEASQDQPDDQENTSKTD